MAENKLEDILQGYYAFVLVSGEYFDCPSCNPGTSLMAKSFYDEQDLIKGILDNAGKDRMEAIWLIDNYRDGDMVKYCDIDTETSNHNVRLMRFHLPIAGKIVIHKEKGVWRVADPAYLLLYEKDLK
jgi:hypothetical protein